MKVAEELIRALYAIRDAIKGDNGNEGGDENINNIFSDYILPDKIGLYLKIDSSANIKMYNNIKEYLDDPEHPEDVGLICLYKKEYSNVEKCFFTIDIDNYNNLIITPCDDSGHYSFELCTDQIMNNPNNEVYYKIEKYK